MTRLENKGERSLQLLQNSLDQGSESELLVLVRVVHIFGEDSNSLGIGLGLKLVPALLQDLAELSAVGNDTIVDNDEVGVGIGTNGMAVDL